MDTEKPAAPKDGGWWIIDVSNDVATSRRDVIFVVVATLGLLVLTIAAQFVHPR